MDVGLIDKITKKQEMSILKAKKVIEKIASCKNTIYTIHEGIKGSKKDDGSQFEEKILMLKFPDITKERAIEVIESIKAALNLEGIWLYESTGEEKN